MTQVQVNLSLKGIQCKFCDSFFKSDAGHLNHLHRIHPLDVPSGLHCFTCNQALTKREVLHQHHQTVRHQINCKNLQKSLNCEEESEIPPSNIREILQHTKQPTCKRSYKEMLMEKKMPEIKKQRKTPVEYLRKEPAIIPLESTIPQMDPRTSIELTFLDLVDSYNNEDLAENTEISQIQQKNCWKFKKSRLHFIQEWRDKTQ